MKPIGLFLALALVLGCASDRPAKNATTEKRVIDDEYATVTMTPAAEPLRSPGGGRAVAPPVAPPSGTRSLDEGVDLGCPMNITEADAVVSLEPHGIALLFRVTPNADDEAILQVRQAARNLALQYSQRHSGQMNDLDAPVQAMVEYEEQPRGARVVLTAEDPAEVDLLRQQVGDEGDRMREARECPEWVG